MSGRLSAIGLKSIPVFMRTKIHAISFGLTSVADHDWFAPSLVRENVFKMPSKASPATKEPLVEDWWASMINVAAVSNEYKTR